MAKLPENGYDLVKPLLESGNINSLQEIFTRKIVRITQFIKDTGKTYSTMQGRLLKPENLKLSDLIKIGEMLNLSPQEVVTLALRDIKPKPSSKKRTKTDK